MPEDFEAPISVGQALCRHILEIDGITRDRLASALGISRHSVSDLVNDRRAVTAPLALRLARVFGTTPQYWMDMQRDTDLRIAQEDMAAEIEALPVLRVPQAGRMPASIAESPNFLARARRWLCDHIGI